MGLQNKYLITLIQIKNVQNLWLVVILMGQIIVQMVIVQLIMELWNSAHKLKLDY